MNSPDRLVVLVVDDEELVLKTTAQLLESLGHRALTASTATEALKRVNDAVEPPVLALVDVFLPDLGGVELAGELARLAPSLRIVFISGETGAYFLQSRCPGARTLLKPLSRERLGEAVHELMADDGDLTAAWH